MILKRVSYDDNHRLVTRWTPEITGAARIYDENWNADVLEVYFKDEPPERMVIHEGDGVYLCNDEGRTIEVLSRLHTSCD